MQLYNIALHIAVLYTGRGVDTGVVTVHAVFALLWLQPVLTLLCCAWLQSVLLTPLCGLVLTVDTGV